jgi:hypothetical protein
VPDYRTFPLSRPVRERVVEWMADALEGAGCRMLRVSEPDVARFRLMFETPMGERMGIVA